LIITGSRVDYDPETGENRELLDDEAPRCRNNEEQKHPGSPSKWPIVCIIGKK